MKNTLKLTLSFGVPLLLFIISSCRREYAESIQRYDVDQVKQWLRSKGGNYKQETITVVGGNGQTFVGTLNWRRAQQYSWEGRNYIDIPFEFAGRGDYLPGNDSIAPAGFNIVIRSRAGDFEGAVRTTAYGTKVTRADGSFEEKTIQTYQLLTGERANIWESDLDLNNPVAFHRKEITKEQYISYKAAVGIKTQKRSAIPGLVASVSSEVPCTPTSYSTYENYCYYATPADEKNQHATCRFIKVTYYNTCPENDDNEGGTNPNPTSPNYPPGGGGTGTTNPPPSPDPPTDPCAQATAAAQKATAVFNDTAVQARIASVIEPVRTTSTIEHGFAIMAKVAVNPHDNTDVSTLYRYTNAVASGTDSSIVISPSYGTHDALLATVHLHPKSGMAAPSPPDIYSVINARTFQMGSFTKNMYQGAYVVAANGSKYSLTITDTTLAKQFYNTMSDNLDGRKWNAESDMGKAFEDAKIYYKKTYKRNANKENLAYEDALAVVLDKFNTGVGLLKYDPSTDSFKPLTRTVKTVQESNGKTSIEYSNPCPTL